MTTSFRKKEAGKDGGEGVKTGSEGKSVREESKRDGEVAVVEQLRLSTEP